MRKSKMHLTQNLILKKHSASVRPLRRYLARMMHQMELEYQEHRGMQLEGRKVSQNTTCHESLYGSPDGFEGRMHGHSSGAKSLRAFSTGVSTPGAEHSPQKIFLTLSNTSLTSLQRRTHSNNPFNNYHSVAIQQNLSIQPMEKEGEEECGEDLVKETGDMGNGGMLLASGKYGNYEANIQISKLAPNNMNLIVQQQEKNNYPSGQDQCDYSLLEQDNQQKQNNHTQQHTIQPTQSQTHTHPSNCTRKSPISPHSQQQTTHHSSSTSSPTTSPLQPTDPRPLPSYHQARPALYTWIRTLCHQMNMCLDVLALTMKYLDQYHVTHNNAYNRYTFTIHAYGMIIIASKVTNKQILTPRLIAEKIGVTIEELEAVEMKLIRMMNFEVYFETFVKKMQRVLERWEERVEEIGLKEELGLFAESGVTYRRFYGVVKEVEKLGRQDMEVTEEMMLDGFVRALSTEFKTKYKASILLAQLLSYTFSQLLSSCPTTHTPLTILTRINNHIANQDQTSLQIQAKNNFERRSDKELYPNYNVFLNSIFQMNI